MQHMQHTRGAATLFSYRNKRHPAIQMYQFMHIWLCRVPPKVKETQITTIIRHSTHKHQFIEDLFAASHHSCSPGWLKEDHH